MFWKMMCLGVAGGGLLGSAPAWAAVEDAALRCTLINDNAARLACFDTVMAAQLPPAAPIRPLAAPGKAVDVLKTAKASADSASPTVVFSGQSPQEQAILADVGAGAALDAYTPLSSLFDLDQNDEAGILSVRAHRPMYLLPAWYAAHPNRNPSSPTQGPASQYRDQDKNVEAKMQISFKTKVAQDLFRTRADLWFGYTQISNWQVYNGSWSAPFRNTDYEPEVFLTQPVKLDLPGGGKLRMVALGAVHQSNGQTDPLSRSWNRLYAAAGAEWGNLTVLPRLWWRIPEAKGSNDNPDISDYMGYGDVKLQYRFGDRQILGMLGRFNPKSGKGAVQLDYTFPVAGKLKGYVQYFNGYGNNLLDYNHHHNSIGIGEMLNDWDGF